MQPSWLLILFASHAGHTPSCPKKQCPTAHRFHLPLPLFLVILILLLIPPPLTPVSSPLIPWSLNFQPATFNCLPPLASLSLITPPTLSLRVGHWRTDPQIVAKKLFTTLFPIPCLPLLGERVPEGRVRADRSQTSRPSDSCLPFSPFPLFPPAHRPTCPLSPLRPAPDRVASRA